VLGSAALATIIGVAALATILRPGAGPSSDPPDRTTQLAPPTSLSPPTSIDVPAVRAALLRTTDVPGSAVAASTSRQQFDFASCLPNAQSYADLTAGPDLDLTSGRVRRQYSSSASRAAPDQAAALVTTFGSPGGSACVVTAIKSVLSHDPSAANVDPSGLTGRGSAAAVADSGVVLTISGSLRASGKAVPTEIELLAFHKGPLIVLLFATTFYGSAVPGQVVNLGRTIAGRLP
jgi:hypothetical protein